MLPIQSIAWGDIGWWKGRIYFFNNNIKGGAIAPSFSHGRSKNAFSNFSCAFFAYPLN